MLIYFAAHYGRHEAQQPAPLWDPGLGLQGPEGRYHSREPRRQARHGHGKLRVTNVRNVTKRDTLTLDPLYFDSKNTVIFNLLSIFIIFLKSFVKFIFSKSESYNLFNFSSELPSLTRTSSKQLRLSRRMFCLQPTISRKKRVTKNICINDHCLYDFAFIYF